MAYPSVTAALIMDASAGLLNDTAKSVYTYIAQIPYLNIALQELQEIFELNDVPITGTVTSSPMIVLAGIDHISYTTQAGLILPSDLIEPQILWERTKNINPYIPMSKVSYLPRYMEGTLIPQLLFYTWEAQEIRFLPANQDNDVKMDYTRNLFTTITISTDTINVINATTFLEFRTGGLCAEFIGENKTRADKLNAFASMSLDRSVGIGTKGRQSIITRHRPFRSAYKRR